MAYTASTITSAENNAFQADRPVLGVSNLYGTNVIAGGTEWTASANPGGTNRDDSDFPATRIYDRRANVGSQPAEVATTAYNFHFQLNPGTDQNQQYDCFWLGNHNIHTLVQAYTESINIDVYVFDWSPKTNEQRIARFAISILDSDHPEPLVAWGLRYDADASTVNRRFSNLDYARIEISKATNFTAATGLPRIGEVVFGRRFQLAHYPRKPVDEEFILESEVEEHPFPDGEIHEVVNFRGRLNTGEVRWRTSTQDTYGLNETQQLRDWWRATKQGTHPTLFCLRPWTNQVQTHYCRSVRKGFSQPVIVNNRFGRDAVLHLSEKPPFYERVVNG